MSYIIGVSAYYHDSAICIIKDGRILFAAQEERYSRIKNDENFPEQALRRGLAFCGISLDEVKAIVFYEKPFLKFERLLETFLAISPRGLMPFLSAMNVWTGRKLFIKSQVRKELKKIDSKTDLNKIALLFSGHHLSHAASAFYPSPFEEAAILTTDGVGEFTTTSLAIGNGKDIQTLKEIHFPHSIGLLYSAITYFLGFKVNSDEYKVMGLAAYGNADSEPVKKYIAIIETRLIEMCDDGSYRLKMENFAYLHSLRMVNDAHWEKLFEIKKREKEDPVLQDHCDLAYAFQKTTEKLLLSICIELKKITGSENICLAGGVALNGVANGLISRSGIFKNIFIQPAAGDAGGALGAALSAAYLHFGCERIVEQPDALNNSLLGCSIHENDILEALGSNKNFIHCVSDDEVCERTARHISEGKVIGWCQGRMEFGPRALGNRSILGEATSSLMQKHLNLKIKNRESFRPFAPAVLEEDVHAYFDFSGLSPYMLQVHPVKAAHLKHLPADYDSASMAIKLNTVKSDIPAVTHVDMSARIQTVNKQQHPLFWQLIHAYKKITGYGLVINTSFNGSDEPIVCSAKDAYACFMKTGIDILVINRYIIYKA